MGVMRAFQLVVDLPVLFQKFIQAVHAQFLYDGVGAKGSVLDVDGSLEHESRVEELKRHPFIADIDWEAQTKKLITPPSSQN
ncbi:hypothetical protein IFR05_012523 [Cadophora sp. M221]|nr:hypothetical protein IFR05_012523 [Cadophora sp. M221]